MAEKKAAKAKKQGNSESANFGTLQNKADLNSFLLGLRDKMTDESAAAFFVASAMNHVLSLPNIYELLSKENKEVARDIWLRLKQSGLQLRTPPLLFSADEEELVAS